MGVEEDGTAEEGGTADEDGTAEENVTEEESTSAPDENVSGAAEESSDTSEGFSPGKGKVVGIIVGVFFGLGGLWYVYRDFSKAGTDPNAETPVETASEGATGGATA